jgi:hypothetical protein
LLRKFERKADVLDFPRDRLGVVGDALDSKLTSSGDRKAGQDFNSDSRRTAFVGRRMVIPHRLLRAADDDQDGLGERDARNLRWLPRAGTKCLGTEACPYVEPRGRLASGRRRARVRR